MLKVQETNRVYTRFAKDSLKLTPYLGMLERPGSGCYGFNQTYFSPVKIEGEIHKVHAFFTQIKTKGAKHLNSDLKNLLLQSRILIPKENKEKPADEWPRSKWEKAWRQEPFFITFGEEVEHEVLLVNFKTWLEHFEYLFCRDRVNTLTVRNFALHSPLSHILSKFDGIYKILQISKRPFKLTWVIDAPLDWFLRRVAEFRETESPHVHFSSDLRNELKSVDLKALTALLNEGFCPHITIGISDLKMAEKNFLQLGRSLGRDGFTYDFEIEKTAICTHSIIEISDFVHQCYCHNELLLRQSRIYTEMLDRIQRHGINNLFANNESMGRMLILDSRKYIKLVDSLKESRKSDWVAALKRNMFGECERSRKKCELCPVRYFCGGVSKSCQCGSLKEQNRMVEITCAIRKRLIYKLLEDATAKPQVKLNQTIKFVPADGTIKIRNAG